MAISKRLRFEILRRDGFRCYYCGTRGNETSDGLTIDHVVAVALGGTDDPENLVSACADCNAGKSSTTTEAELVAEIDQAVAVQHAARVAIAARVAASLEAEDAYRDSVWEQWYMWAPSYASDPADLDGYVDTWFKEHVPTILIEKAFRVAFTNKDVPVRSKVAYAGGVIRNTMKEAERDGP